MNNLFGAILVTAVAGILGTGLGGVLAVTVKRGSDRIIGLLLSFAAGITLGTVCFDFISEALHAGDDHDHSSIAIVALGVVLGYALVYLLDRIVSEKAHHDHSDHGHRECGCCENNPRKMIVAGAVMAVSVAIHNLPVGIVIGTCVAAEPGGALSAGVLITALAIILHNIPEGMAVTVPFISGGVKKPHALLLTSACGFTTVIGGIVGFQVGSISPIALTVMLSFAAGAMLYVIFNELIPEAISCACPRSAAAMIFVGLMISMLIVFSGGHSHA